MLCCSGVVMFTTDVPTPCANSNTGGKVNIIYIRHNVVLISTYES
jgi:hypothetical protein